MKLHAGHMQLAVVKLIDFRKHPIIPNVSYGFFGMHYESDLIVIDNNKITEIEIKISLQDLKADFLKTKHQNPFKLIHRLIYAIPYELLEKALPIIPKNYGIILVKTLQRNNLTYYKASYYRIVRFNNNPSIENKHVIKLLELAAMRIWNLKKIIYSK